MTQFSLEIQELATRVEILSQHNLRIRTITAVLGGNNVFDKKTSHKIEQSSLH